MRIAPEISMLVESTVSAASQINSAGQHLANAWNGAYGRTPDPVKAYSEAIKAVEAAAATVLTPTDLKATLGTLRGHLKSSLAPWRFVIGSDSDTIETVLDMISMLWDGQTSRHGGVHQTREETPEEAEAALHLAATLVQWFISGAVRRS